MRGVGSALPHRDLAYLVEGTDEFEHYIRELTWAQRFALLNRAEMLDRIVGCLAEWAGVDVDRAEVVQCHHNYTARERHFDSDVWLTRKGAIDASEGRPVCGSTPRPTWWPACLPATT